MALKDQLKDVLMYGNGGTKKPSTTKPAQTTTQTVYNQPFIDGYGSNGTTVSTPITPNIAYNQPFTNSVGSNGTVVTKPAISQPSYNQPFVNDGVVSSVANQLNTKKPAVSTPSTSQPTTSSSADVASSTGGRTSSGGNGGYSGSQQYSAPQQSDYYAELMAAIDAQTRARKDAQLAALDAQLKRGLSDYDAQIGALDPIYQGYRNESEVERYKAQKALRESQANRGTFDSGLGRQEVLDLQTNYGNNLNAINMQYQAELDALNRAKQALNDEAAAQRIQIESDIENAGLEGKIAALRDQINAQQQLARQSASSVVSSGSKSSKSLSSSGAAFLNSMQQQSERSRRNHTANEVESALRSGYNQGVLNENDVKLIRSYYGI